MRETDTADGAVRSSSAPQRQNAARVIAASAKDAVERHLLEEWIVSTMDRRPRPTVAEIVWTDGTAKAVER